MASLKQLLERQPPDRILAVRSDRVGDLLLSTPFLAGLRQGFPQARITALVAPYCAEVLEGTGLVDEIVTELPADPFDLAISLAPRSESLRTVFASGAPLRLGYVYDGRPLVRLASRRYLTHREVVVVKPPRQVAHEVEHLDILARRLGLPSILGEPLRLGQEKGEVKPGRLVFHLGDRWFTNGWELSDLLELIAGLSENHQVLVTAGPRERELLTAHGSGLDGVELASDLTFSEWAQAIGEAGVLVSPDTGAVHVAAAMQTPVVVAYEESTFDHCSHQWSPWRVPYRAVVKGHPGGTITAVKEAVAELVRD